MQNPHLLEATGSEPLTWQEEVEHQQSWCLDESKCIFIVLAKDKCCDLEREELQVSDNLHAMVGDVNLFLSNCEDDDEEFSKEATTNHSKTPGHQRRQAEVDIMIAEADYQGKGLGREATLLMMLYGAQQLGICRYFCKINETNEASMSLFKKKLGFVEKEYIQVFGQYELELTKDNPEEMKMHLIHMVGELMIAPCPLHPDEEGECLTDLPN
jgi:RimJ/RimL family protein N-acetyltransferase